MIENAISIDGQSKINLKMIADRTALILTGSLESLQKTIPSPLGFCPFIRVPNSDDKASRIFTKSFECLFLILATNSSL